MSRIDPIDGTTELLDADYRNAIRGIAFRLLADGNCEALETLWAVLSDDASRHFTARDSATSEHMRVYWQSKRRDCLDLLAEVEDAYRHVPGNAVSGA